MTTLAQSLALEGFRDGVLCNAIATGGLTRMTEGMGTHDALLPEHTALGVAMLCHESCTETAGLFRVEGWAISHLDGRSERGEGDTGDTDASCNLVGVAENQLRLHASGYMFRHSNAWAVPEQNL